jgi:hypothetical protein
VGDFKSPEGKKGRELPAWHKAGVCELENSAPSIFDSDSTGLERVAYTPYHDVNQCLGQKAVEFSSV